MHISNKLKYIRAPMLNQCLNYNILTNRQLIVTNPISKVYIRSPRWRYKLLPNMHRKKKDRTRSDIYHTTSIYIDYFNTMIMSGSRKALE